MTTWLISETAPKDGSVIIADFGWPWPVPAVWNNSSNEWVLSILCMSELERGSDTYFENEYQKQNELKRWQPMPTLEK